MGWDGRSAFSDDLTSGTSPYCAYLHLRLLVRPVPLRGGKLSTLWGFVEDFRSGRQQETL